MIAPRIYIFFMLLFSSTIVFGQASKKYTGEYADFYTAEELFQKEQYSAARELFSTFMEAKKDKQDPLYVKAYYYKGISALELYNNDAIKILSTFNHEYPENIYKNEIYFRIGDNFYQRKKYKETKEWLDKTDPNELDTAFISAYHFKLGYSNFQLDKLEEARSEFYEIKDGNSNFSAPALYYYSFIAYKNKGYKEALEGFLKLTDNAVFQNEVSNYIIQIYYLLGDYNNVIAFENAKNTQNISENQPNTNLLIGQSYYKTKQFGEAIPYLEDYQTKASMTRDEEYSLAYAYFKDEQLDKAIRLFDRVAKTKDELGQTSYYHIAQAYIQKEELNYARIAFKAASDLDFAAQIQEDALYNYAVLSYKLDYNPYNEAIKAFELFLATFPDSDKQEDVYSYLVNVYMHTKKYDEAIKSLNRIPVLNIKLKTAYQVISYNMGIEKYERGDFQGSIKALKDVSKYDISPKITGKAKYWEADAYFMQKKWSESVVAFRNFLSVPGMNDLELREAAYYNIAYAYFYQEDWTQAIQAFRTFTQLSNIQDKSKLADAYTRLGDVYYTKDTPEFQRAVMNYESALQYAETDKKDRILYSLSKVYRGMTGQRNQQIATLEEVLKNYPQSSYKITAIYDIAGAYKNEREYEKALASFNSIVNDYPDNILVKDALIEIGDMMFKQQKYKEAESYFKRVLDEYLLDDKTCKSVTNGIVDVYRAMRRQDEIAALGQKYPCAEISSDDEEIFYYEAASELYVNEKYEEAIPELEKYLDKYPEGRFSMQILSYLGDIYFRQKDEERMTQYYEQIIRRPASPYTELALIRVSKLYYNSEQFEKALEAYQILEKLSSQPDVVFNTRVGLLRTNFLLQNFSEALIYAEKALSDKLMNEDEIKIEANFVAGMSCYNMAQPENAVPYLRWTADNTGKPRGTEALFTLSEVYFQMENYAEAEKIHNELLQRKPTYDYWIAKSLILQSKVFMVTDNLFQAEQTIDLVIDKYPDKESDIIEEAEKVKSEILQLKEFPDAIENNNDERIINLNDEDNE